MALDSLRQRLEPMLTPNFGVPRPFAALLAAVGRPGAFILVARRWLLWIGAVVDVSQPTPRPKTRSLPRCIRVSFSQRTTADAADGTASIYARNVDGDGER